MRAKFVLTEAATGLWRNVTMTVALILTTAISLALLGAGGLLFYEVGKIKDLLYAKVQVSIFLTKDVTQEQRADLASRLERDPLVKSATYEDEETARRRYRELFEGNPDLLEAASKPGVLPESYRVVLYEPTKSGELAREYRDMPGVLRVSNPEKLLDKLFGTLDAVKNTAFLISLVQGVAAVLLIANTIQVAAYSRRREVSIMKLVGASNWYVRLPFVLEAAVAGLIGAVIAFLGLVLSKWLLLDGPLQPLFTSIIPVIRWHDILLTGPILALVAVVVAAITGWFTLRFYVKV